MITRSRFKKAGAGWAAPALEAFQADDSVNNQMRLKTFRPAGVGQAVVAHSCGENLVQKADLPGTELVLPPGAVGDRKSTRLNSSHVAISYAVFCLKKKMIQVEWAKSLRTVISFEGPCVQ